MSALWHVDVTVSLNEDDGPDLSVEIVPADIQDQRAILAATPTLLRKVADDIEAQAKS